MTFGVDECRVCGVPIRVSGPRAMEQYLWEQRLPPAWPEARWRAAGFKASPSRVQLRNPASGCCPACGLRLARKRVAPFRKFLTLLGCILVAFGLIFTFSAIYPH